MKARLYYWGHEVLAHKGEHTCHVAYLVMTVVEGHGLHTIFAGGVVFFMFASRLFTGGLANED
jgi:hypothetical protein